MTGSPPPGLPHHHRDTGHDERQTPHLPPRKRAPTPCDCISALNIVRRPGLRPQGPTAADAVALRASLDPDAQVDCAHNKAEKPERRLPEPLTPPAPTGMTCTITTQPSNSQEGPASSASARAAGQVLHSAGNDGPQADGGGLAGSFAKAAERLAASYNGTSPDAAHLMPFLYLYPLAMELALQSTPSQPVHRHRPEHNGRRRAEARRFSDRAYPVGPGSWSVGTPATSPTPQPPAIFVSRGPARPRRAPTRPRIGHTGRPDLPHRTPLWRLFWSQVAFRFKPKTTDSTNLPSLLLNWVCLPCFGVVCAG